MTYETHQAMWEELPDIIMPEPSEETWDTIGKEFLEKMQFPNYTGTLNSKLIRLQKQTNKQTNNKQEGTST